MALRYGGEVRTRSAVRSASGSSRASPPRTEAPVANSESLKGSRATAVRNLRVQASRGSTTALSDRLWGRERGRSRAEEAPADLAMIKLEKTTQAKSFSFPLASSSMAWASAQSCSCDLGGNQ